ncbi:MAG: DNA repair exonuclease [Thermoproteota archaeon]
MLVSHISDLHLGYSQFNLEEREEDVYETFYEAIDTSIREGARLVVLAGDIFHTPRPNGKAVYRLAGALKKLKEKEIPAVFVLGEHDISRMRDIPFAYVFRTLGLARHLKLDEPFVAGDCAVYGADKERRGNIDSLVEKMRQAGELAQKRDGDKKKKILVLHQGLTDLNKFAGELNSSDIPGNFQYYAMGHYHDRYEKYFPNLGGPLVYPGSLDLTPSEGIKEVDKGFALVDMSGEEASVQFVTLARRPQFSVRIDYDRMAEGVEGILRKAAGLAKKPVVRVEIASSGGSSSGKSIDSKVVAGNLTRLNEACLHYVWQSLDDKEGSPSMVYDERPADLDAELLRLARDALGSEEAARLAILDLLPPAAAGDASSALDIVWDMYKKKKRVQKKLHDQRP